MKDINFALVEETRPPLYTAMKYWGKKPHNIWGEYIKHYTSEIGLYLDPFAGSAMSAFEAVKAGRKAIAFDLNPLTSFIIETYCGKFDSINFQKAVKKITTSIGNDDIYLEYFSKDCDKCRKHAIAQHFKWEKNELYELGVLCDHCHCRYIARPTVNDKTKARKMANIKIKYWYPTDTFHNTSSFSSSFISCVGGDNFYQLWTRRNLYIISKIFNSILDTTDNNLKNQLLLGFIKTIHLCSKMCIPRRELANRAFSTSWGRSAYICSSRQMEMNPLLVFKSSCVDKKQSVISAMSAVRSYLGKQPKTLYVDDSNKSNRTKNFDIKYGIVDVNTITNFIDNESVDFILTDPPYGGLVQYLDLSTIWLIWLKKINPKYTPNFKNEITIKNKRNIDDYNLKFQKAVKNLYKVLRPEGKIVFTFHNKDIKIWNAFLKAIRLANFDIEKVIHQQNKRTGESNVANPYGTSGADFYIRCVKSSSGKNRKISSETEQEFKNRVICTAIGLVAQRNEPTPYQILFNGILAEVSSAGFDIEDFDINIKKILENKIGVIFKITENNDNVAGKYWWFIDPSKYIDHPDRDLNDRLEATISSFLRNKQTVSFDDVLGKVFTKYINGLTPEIKSIDNILKKYAHKHGSMWHYNGCDTELMFTDHTRMLALLSSIGKKNGYDIYVGKAEQSDKYNNKTLSQYADIISLDTKNFNFTKERRSRIEMIDMLWIKNGEIKYAIEVENSTKFTSGLQRASNLGFSVEKIMVLPDEREKELRSIGDPLFVEGFNRYNWKYLLYKDVLRLDSARDIKTLLNILLKKL